MKARWIPLLAALAAADSVPALDVAGDASWRRRDENLLFEVSYLGLTGGYARMEAHADPAAPRARELVLSAWTTPVVSTIYRLRMTLTSRLESDALVTRWYCEDRRERENHWFHILDFDADGSGFRFGEIRDGRTNYERVARPGRTADAVSSFYVARCLPLRPGDVYHMPVTYHQDRHRVEVVTVGRTTIRTRWGRQPVVVVKPVMNFRGIFLNEGEMLISLSDDEYRCPLRMESRLIVGSFQANLIEGYPGPKR